MIDYLITCFTTEKTPERLENLYKCISSLNSIGISPIVACNQVMKHNYNYTRIHIGDKYFNKLSCYDCLVQAAKHDRIMFLDCDILVPKDFDFLCNETLFNNSCYFPICYRLNKGKPVSIYLDEDAGDDEIVEAHGGWCTSGYGIFGLKKHVWFKIRDKIPTDVADSWGLEDNLIYDECRKVSKTVRHKCLGLFHIWHPKSIDYRNKNHALPSGESINSHIKSKQDKYYNRQHTDSVGRA